MRHPSWLRLELPILIASVTGCAGVDGGDGGHLMSARLGTPTLDIHQINVGWGESVFIKGPSATVLLEAGNTGSGTSRVVPYLQSIGVQPANGFDYTIAGHQHCDHIGGMDEVINAGYNVRIANFYNGSTYASACADSWKAAATTTTAGAPIVPTPGEQLQLGNGATLTFLAVNGQIIGGGSVAVSDENDRSIAALIHYGGFDYLWASDLGGGSIDTACTGRSTAQVDVETSVIQAISPGGVHPLISAGGIDVLNVNHHGSESSTNMNWLNYAQPAVALIGTGAGQTSGWDLPRIDVVEHVLGAQVPCITAAPPLVLQTEEGAPAGSLTSFAGYCVGDIHIATDGSTFTVSADGQVSEGPNEVAAAGLPRSFNVDDGQQPPDTTAPVTALTAPADGATVTGSVAVTASASDDVGVARVELWLDGALLATDTSAPYGWTWDTTTVAAGAHGLHAEAYDAAGNRGLSPTITVTVESAPPPPAVVIINEILANEPGSDTNGEFVELVNLGGSAADLGGWTVSDGTSVRHTFAAGTSLAGGRAIVVFGGASAIPAGLSNAVAASTGALSFNNSGDTVRLADATGAQVDAFTYGSSLAGTDGVSMNRNPDASATGTFVLHTTISSLSNSPGKRANGQDFALCQSNADCSDGNLCNGAETCVSGNCQAGTPPSCDDANPCTADSCDALAGCTHAPVADGTSCSDGNACNGAETCQAGSCAAGTPLSCDDGNLCTDDSCSPTAGCVHANNTAPCDDGNACTTGDVCRAGVCAGSNSCVLSIASDGFEGGFSGGTGWGEASWRVSGDTAIVTSGGPHAGTSHARLRRSTGSMKRVVNLAAHGGARLKVWLKVSSFEGSDHADVRVSVDGAYHSYDLDLGVCDGLSSCEIYFDAGMSSRDDLWYIDDVEVTSF